MASAPAISAGPKGIAAPRGGAVAKKGEYDRAGGAEKGHTRQRRPAEKPSDRREELGVALAHRLDPPEKGKRSKREIPEYRAKHPRPAVAFEKPEYRAERDQRNGQIVRQDHPLRVDHRKRSERREEKQRLAIRPCAGERHRHRRAQSGGKRRDPYRTQREIRPPSGDAIAEHSGRERCQDRFDHQFAFTQRTIRNIIAPCSARCSSPF